jgi:hypothetical protein
VAARQQQGDTIMLRAWFKHWTKKAWARAKPRTSRRPQLETLEARCVPSVTEAWVNTGAFGYFITDMPDIDQLRETVPGSLVGLPNNGSEYCVPTATMNELAYLANHGFSYVGPGPNDWQLGPPSNTPVYNTMSNDLLALGSMMGTDPFTGTNGYVARTAAQAWLDSYAPGDFAVSLYFIHVSADSTGMHPLDTYAPSLGDMAMQAIDGNLIAPGVGWYTNADTNLPHYRIGGHQLSLIEAHGGLLLGSSESVGFSDPYAHTLLTAQGPFTETQVNVHDVTGTFSGQHVTLSRFDDYQSGYLDNYISIRPTFALSADANILYLNFPIQLLGGPPREVTRAFVSATGGNILDLAVSPEKTQHPYLIEGSNAVWQIDDITGTSSKLADVMHPERLVYGGADQSLYVLTDKQIVRLSRNGRPEDYAPLDFKLDAITYDQSTDSVVGVSTAAKKIYFFDHHLRSIGQADLALPDTGPGTGHWSLTAEEGGLLLHRDGSPTIYRLSHGDTTGWVTTTITLQGAIDPTGLSTNEIGHLFVTENHKIVEYDATGHRVEGSRFTGLPGGQVVQMLMPFSNFDPRIDTGLAYQNVLPQDAIPPVGRTQSFDLRGSYQGFAELRGSSQAIPVQVDLSGTGMPGQWTGPITLHDMRFTVEATVSSTGELSGTGAGNGISFMVDAIVTDEGDGALSIAGRFEARLGDGSMLAGDLAVVRAPQGLADHPPNVAGTYDGASLSTYTGTTSHEFKNVVLSQQGNRLTGFETTFNDDGSVRSTFRLVGVVNDRGEFHMVGVGDGTLQALQGRFASGWPWGDRAWPWGDRGWPWGDKKAALEGVFELRSTGDLHTVVDRGIIELFGRRMHLGKHMLADMLPPGMRTPADMLPPGMRTPADMLPPGMRTPADLLPPGERKQLGMLLPGTRTPADTLPQGTRTPADTLPQGTRSPADMLPPGTRKLVGMLPPGKRTPVDTLDPIDDVLDDWPPQPPQ